MGYGLSVWVVPKLYEEIQEEYNMVHIPHVTLQTNLQTHSNSADIGRLVNISFIKGFVKFPSMYDHDPMSGSGFYCSVADLYNIPAFDQHMTVWYNYDGDHMGFDEPPCDQLGRVMRADTRSDDPSEWTVLF